MMNIYPTADDLLTSHDEPMLELKRSPRSMLGFLSLAAFLFIVVTIIVYFFGSYTFALYIVPIGFGVEAARRYHDDLYVFEDEKITHQGGRLSLQYSVPAIRYIDIRAISVTQSFTGRIFDYGNVELNTAAQDQGEVYLEGIRAPDELAYIVEEIRRHHLNKREPNYD